MARKRLDNPDDAVMSFGDHIEELRRRLIHSIIGIGIAMLITLWYGRDLIAFIYAPLAEIQRLADLPTQTYTRSSVSGFAIYVKVSLIAAMILSAPWIMFQVWRFVETGLYAAERKTATILMAMSGIMTALALAFMYYLFLPATLSFFIFWTTTYPIPESGGDSLLRRISQVLTDFNKKTIIPGANMTQATTSTAPASTEPVILPTLEKDPEKPVEGQVWFNQRLNETRQFRNGRVQVFTVSAPSMMVPLIDPNEYLSEVMMLTLIIVIVFHVPVVMAVLGLTGIVKPETLSKRRKYIVFGCFVVAIFFTPAQDIFSNVALPILMWGLFEVGLVFMRYFYRPHRIRDAEWEKDDAASKA